MNYMYLSSFCAPLPHPRGLSGRTHRSLKPCFPRADMQLNGGKKKAQGQSHPSHQWDCCLVGLNMQIYYSWTEVWCAICAH